MVLDDRKVKILMAIIDDYIKNAEPVGSGTIVKRYDIGVSPATIRNEMANLEELGLLLQPHTSAGRVPSEKAYRLYVNELMKKKQVGKAPISNIQDILRAKIDNPDELIREIARIVSKNTLYAAIVTKPHSEKSTIKYIQLINIDENSVLLVLVINKDIVKNHIFKANIVITQEKLDQISKVLNKNFINHSLKDINIELIHRVGVELVDYRNILAPILDVIANTIKGIDKQDCYVAGMKNILDFPEFNDLEKARDMMKFLEESEGILKILNMYQSDSDKIMVRIGSENGFSQVDKCSIISVKYNINDSMYGTIAIIGPTRMDYLNTVTLLNGLIKQVNGL
ncbi:MAG: heat-inducible transcription repressor HrcA [Clostridiales bacterium GWD2_32_19]|nr:MAG: heat-inducible transcription repressor HrcA [Clostridiales bacterium GWD2_32_19]